MVESGVQPRPLGTQSHSKLLDLSPGGDKDRDASLLLNETADVPLIEELLGLLRKNLNLRLETGVERLGSEHLRTLQILRVEGGIDRSTQPDEAAPGPLPQRKAQLQLGGGLVYLIYDDGVARSNQVVLEPAPGDTRRNNHHIPAGGLRSCLALTIHHTHLERLPQDRLGDGPDT